MSIPADEYPALMKKKRSSTDAFSEVDETPSKKPKGDGSAMGSDKGSPANSE